MSKALTEFERIATELKASGNWPPRWDNGEEVEENDLALYVAAGLWLRGAAEGRGMFQPVSSPEDALTGASSRVLPEIRQRMLADPTCNLWPEVVRGLPNPSGIVWAYSPVRRDYAGARVEPGRSAGLLRSGRAPRVRILSLPEDWNEVWKSLGADSPMS